MKQNQQSVQIQAKSVDLALEKAEQQLGVAKQDLAYEVISQTSAGFLSFLGAKKVELKVWTKNPRRNSRATNRQQNRSKPQPVVADSEQLSKEPLSKAETEALVEDLKDFCAGICKYLSSSEKINVEATLEDNQRLNLNVHDDEIAQILAKNSRLAESLEHILRKKPRYLRRELPFRIFIDAQGLRTSREQELVEMARDLSAKVAENQKPIVLNYKSSYDRKIIHMALDQDHKVYTKSIGTGANRKLMILPVKDEQARSDQYE